MLRIPFFVPLFVLAAVTTQRGLGQDPSPGPADAPDSAPTPDSSTPGTGRAYLGVGVSQLRPDLAILEVVPGSPAQRAGLRAGDRIVSLDGGELNGADDLTRKIAAKKPGDQVKVGIERGTERLDIDVTLGETTPAPRLLEPPSEDATERAFLGVGYGEVSPALAVHLGLDFGYGVLVGAVHPGSAAEKAGIVTYDVIVKVDDELVRGRLGLVELIRRRRPGESVRLHIIHRGQPGTKSLVLGERPRGLRPPSRLNDPLWIPSPLGPRGSWRGRLRIGPDSAWDIPWEEFDQWPDGLPESLRGWLDDGGFDESVRRHVREALKDFDSGTHSRSASTLRVIEGDLDVTVTTEDGETLVTVKKDGETVAKDLPLEELDTLPANLRDAVRAVIDKQKTDIIEPPARVPEPDRIDAGDRVKI